LAIVRAVAESHAGSVSAARSAYGGARFSIRLPIVKAPAPEGAPDATAEDRSANV
jgi:two-component system sensor histidine kinase MprB